MRRPEAPRPRRPDSAAPDDAGSRASSLLGAALGYLLLVGGRTSRTGAMMDELWRGRINRLGYGR